MSIRSKSSRSSCVKPGVLWNAERSSIDLPWQGSNNSYTDFLFPFGLAKSTSLWATFKSGVTQSDSHLLYDRYAGKCVQTHRLPISLVSSFPAPVSISQSQHCIFAYTPDAPVSVQHWGCSMRLGTSLIITQIRPGMARRRMLIKKPMIPANSRVMTRPSSSNSSISIPNFTSNGWTLDNTALPASAMIYELHEGQMRSAT